MNSYIVDFVRPQGNNEECDVSIVKKAYNLKWEMEEGATNYGNVV